MSRDVAGHRPALQWSQEAEAVYREIVERGPRKLADLMQALLAFLGCNDMMAFPMSPIFGWLPFNAGIFEAVHG